MCARKIEALDRYCVPLNFHLIYFLNTTQQETYRGRNHDLDGFKMPAVSDNIDEVNTTDPHDMFVPHEMFELRTRKRDLKGKSRNEPLIRNSPKFSLKENPINIPWNPHTSSIYELKTRT